VIDGFSRKEWLFSKIGLAKILALFSTILVAAIGFFLGYAQGTDAETSQIFMRLDFVFAYFIELIVYFVYALFLVLILKRTGISIILLLVYDFILEPIISWSIPEPINDFLPMNTLDNLNTFPFSKYVGNEIQDIVSIEPLVWAVVYGIIFSGLTYLILKKRDL